MGLKGVLLAFCRCVSAKELLMVYPKEDSTSFLAALLMSGTCNYSFLLSSVNSLYISRALPIDHFCLMFHIYRWSSA